MPFKNALILTFLMTFLLFPLRVSAADESSSLSLRQIINLAGSQRMLSQRIVKSYCQIGLGIFVKDSSLAIKHDVARFESQINVLKKYSDDEIYQEMLEWVSIAWKRFKPLVTAPVSREQVLRINHLAEDLLYVSDQVTIRLQDAGNQRGQMMVNLAGRQRMLAQRLGKLYMLKSWGFDLLSINNSLLQIKEEFNSVLERLREAPETTQQTLADLDEVIIEWTWFRSVLERQGEVSYGLIVADASDSLMKMLDKITGQYTTRING